MDIKIKKKKKKLFLSLSKNAMETLLKFSKSMSSIIKGNHNQQTCF